VTRTPAEIERLGPSSPAAGRRPTIDERRAAGRAARKRLPRGDLAGWNRAERPDPLLTIDAQNAMRLAELVPLRHERMSESPWAFYRGAAAVMAADLGSRPDTGLTVQLCGDAHVLNFGLWATPERQLSFDLRDFDETLPGPFEWDVSRLVASIVVLATDNGVKLDKAERAVAECLRAYRERIARYARAKPLDVWYDLITADHLIALFKPADQELLVSHIARKAKRRTSAGAARKLTERVDGTLRITEDPPVRVRLADDELALEDAIFAAYRASLPEYRRALLDRFSFVDAVRQVVGVGSVGMRVFLVLLTGRNTSDPLFLQIKQAGPSVYEPYCGESAHDSHGERVVVGKRLIQSATDIFAGFTSIGGDDYYVRQFRDMKVIPRGDLIAPRLAEFAIACGQVLARAHARTGDAIAIDAYIGRGRRFDAALGEFAVAYADQTARDHRRLADAVADRPIDSIVA
jgi:uncharacterized protein (DUF2252 family)